MGMCVFNLPKIPAGDHEYIFLLHLIIIIKSEK